MKTDVRESSLDVYYGVVVPSKVQGQQAQVLKAMARLGGWVSRRQIAREAGMETSTVSARVNALKSTSLIEEAEDLRKCPITGTRVHMIRISDSLRRAA